LAVGVDVRVRVSLGIGRGEDKFLDAADSTLRVIIFVNLGSAKIIVIINVIISIVASVRGLSLEEFRVSLHSKKGNNILDFIDLNFLLLLFALFLDGLLQF
jgi:hypothetical protein